MSFVGLTVELAFLNQLQDNRYLRCSVGSSGHEIWIGIEKTTYYQDRYVVNGILTLLCTKWGTLNGMEAV